MIDRSTASGAIRRAVLAVAVFGCAVSAAEETERHEVSQLRWSNHGGYAAVVSVRWKDQETGEQHSSSHGCSKEGPLTIPRGNSQEIMNGQWAQCTLQIIADKGTTLSPGDEVWLHINIESGDNKSCRKDDKRTYFDPDSTRQATFSSGGTTLNDNRCKWRGVEDI